MLNWSRLCLTYLCSLWTIRDYLINFTDKLMLTYISGTTGLPKAAVITHARYILGAGGLTILIGVNQNAVVYCPCPCTTLSGCMSSGISMVMRDRFSASSSWAGCVKYDVTATQYIGEICRYLLNTPSCKMKAEHKVRLVFNIPNKAEL